MALRNSITLALVGIPLVLTFQHSHGREIVFTACIAFATLPLASILGLTRAALLGLKATLLATVPEVIVQPLALLALIGVAKLLTPYNIQAPMAFFAFAVATAAALLLNWYWLKPRLGSSVLNATPELDPSVWRSTALPLFFIAAMGTITAETGTLMVGALMGPGEAGIYKAASQTSQLPALGLAAVNAIMAPLIAQLHVQGRIRELQSLITLGVRGTSAFTLIAIALLLTQGKLILGLFGVGFDRGYQPLVILSMGQIASALTGSVGLLMTMTGGHDTANRIFVSTAILNVALCAGLIPVAGMTGAAAAASISTATWNVVFVIVVWKRLDIWSFVVPRAAGRDANGS